MLADKRFRRFRGSVAVHHRAFDMPRVAAMNRPGMRTRRFQGFTFNGAL